MKLLIFIIFSTVVVCVLAATTMHHNASMKPVTIGHTSRLAKVVKSAKPGPAPKRRPLEFYASHGQLRWSMPQPPPPSPPVQIYGPVYVPPVIPPDPLANFVFAGFALFGNQPQALLEDRRDHQGVWHVEGDSFQGFTIERITRDSIALAQGPVRRNIARSDTINVVQLLAAADAGVTGLPDPGNVTQYRGQNYQTFFFQVTGRLSGPVYGTDLYTDDSDLGSAAVHAAILREGQSGTVKVTILPGANQYEGSVRNGVSSSSYASWSGSYRIERVLPSNPPQNNPNAVPRKSRSKRAKSG